MNAETLLLVLPSVQDSAGGGLTLNQWGNMLDQFAGQGGRELLLGGAEPLAFPGFWVLVRRGIKAKLPRVTAYLSGALLEPWVMRTLVESGIHLLVALDGLQPEKHDAMHGPGSHARAMAAIETFLNQGLSARLGILATATELNRADLPVLAAWAAGRGLSRVVWTCVPDGGWPSEQLKALRLSPQAKMELAEQMHAVARGVAATTYVGPLDMLEDAALFPGCSPLLRVANHGEASWGFSGDGGYAGNLKWTGLADLLSRNAQAAGD
ncbi:MAG: radical additional 4Fe4S-binding domain protein [Symbiobacteriaceae bacterium]|jgi:MoaA/NifB/PqqE/SkfB family radical SAM enzyme|nr:radical additional 4Fe4S-binding domain protein [Symbiobacteriaceae bacterium]